MSFGFGIGDFIAAIQLVNELRQKWIDAPAEYTSIRSECRGIENVLRSLDDLGARVEISARQKIDLTDASTSCIEVLRRADEIVSEYSSLHDATKTVPGRVRRSWKRFKLDPDDIRHVRDQLTASMTRLGAIQNNIEIDMMREMTGDLGDLHLSEKQHKKLQIADWFAPSSFADQQSDQLARRQTGTAQWFLHSPQYIEWRQNPNQTLFCPGIPGSGKTVIIATAIDDLRQYFDQRQDIVVAYFYCNYRRQSEQTLNQMLAALVRQVFQERVDVPDAVTKVYQEHKDRRTRPSNDELKRLLRILVLDYTRVFILIDALDECTNRDTSRDSLVDELFGLQTSSDGHTSLLTTGRFIPEVTCRFEACLRLEIKAQKEDVETYLNGRMSELCSGVKRNKLLQDEIKTSIVSAVDGMFLLARLHFDSLQDQMTPKAVRQALAKLHQGPEALDAAYEEAMNRIKQQSKGLSTIALRVLTWIVYARKELSVEELQEAIAIEPEMEEIDHNN